MRPIYIIHVAEFMCSAYSKNTAIKHNFEDGSAKRIQHLKEKLMSLSPIMNIFEIMVKKWSHDPKRFGYDENETT